MKSGLRVLGFVQALVLFIVLVSTPLMGSAEGEKTDRDAYANQWARSDLRAWLNGLTKTRDWLPLDGSSGTGQSYNFLRFFTDAELNLFQPRDVTTVMFNDGEFNGTTSEVVTKDRFWLPSGFAADGTGIQFTCEDIIISADPSCDLSDYYTVRQKVKNGKANNWKYLIPVPYWGGNNYDSTWLRSAYYEEMEVALTADTGFSVNGFYDVDKAWAYSFACGAVSLPSNLFAAAAQASSESGYLNRKEIAPYDRLGVKETESVAPSWGMYIKQISLGSLSGSLTYDNASGTLTFTSSAALPKDTALMVQAYKEWDSNRTATENARRGDTFYAAGKGIINGSTTSVVFSSTVHTEHLNGFTVKVWVETLATENSLAQASAPLTFRIDSTGSATEVTETKSGNPRVFAYRSDLACSWGTLDLSSQVSGEDNSFNERFLYAGNDATWQKLYIGTTGEYRKPIEWWIAGRDGDSLMLYQASYAETSYIEFDRRTYNYSDTVKNPSLELGDIGYDDLSNPFAKLTLRPNKDSQDELDAPASSYSLQFCAENGFEWEDSLPVAGGKTYVRAKYAGGTIAGTKYAPCYSNIKEITVPVKYPVTVTNGTGGGSYAEGAGVEIAANEPAQGERFAEWTWTGDDSLTFTSGSKTSASATFTMPAREVEVTANYEDIPSISAKVTFKVVNGCWNEGDKDKADMTVTLTGYEGDTLKLSADQIPAAGNEPDINYKEGSWDTTPSTETAITGDDNLYTYTYTEQSKISYKVTFKVVNGEWDQGGSEDKTVTLSRYEYEDLVLYLKDGDIPQAGHKPANGFKEGSWDEVPTTDRAVSSNLTFTYSYEEKERISENVTFRVANGSWDDGTAAEKTVTLTGHVGDTLKLAEGQIPSVGSKPAEGFRAGAWDVTPSTETAITKATTYTYTYAKKEPAVVVTAPVARSLTYNESAQELVIAGTASGGTMQYVLGSDTATVPTAGWSADVPTGTDVGTYYVWYKAAGDENHLDSAPAVVTAMIREADTWSVTVTAEGIGTAAADPASGMEGTLVKLTAVPGNGYAFKEWQVVSGGVTVVDDCLTIGKQNVAVKAVFTRKPSYFAVSGEGTEWRHGSDGSLTFVFKRTENDTATFDHFTGIACDGQAVPERDAAGNANWSARRGSLVLTLNPVFLETLSVGKHTVQALFDDGAAAASFTVVEGLPEPTATPAPTPEPSATPKPVPKTGDSGRPGLWIGLILLGMLGLAAAGTAMALKRKKR